MGLQKNSAPLERVAVAEHALAEQYEATGTKQRLIGEFRYATRSWERERRVIARLEHSAQGPNPRFVVTSLEAGEAKSLYEDLYCARGEAENRIKEAQIDCSDAAAVADASRQTSYVCSSPRWPTR